MGNRMPRSEYTRLKRLRFVFTLVIICASAPMPAQIAKTDDQPAPQANNKTFDANEFSSRSVAMTRDWLANRLSTVGASAELRELKRARRDEDLFVVYQAFVRGVPKNQLYDLVQWPMNAEKPLVAGRGLHIASDGLVMSQEHAVEFAFHPARGEHYRLGLVSA